MSTPNIGWWATALGLANIPAKVSHYSVFIQCVQDVWQSSTPQILLGNAYCGGIVVKEAAYG
jgi:hypothetical protein